MVFEDTRGKMTVPRNAWSWQSGRGEFAYVGKLDSALIPLAISIPGQGSAFTQASVTFNNVVVTNTGNTAFRPVVQLELRSGGSLVANNAGVATQDRGSTLAPGAQWNVPGMALIVTENDTIGQIIATARLREFGDPTDLDSVVSGVLGDVVVTITGTLSGNFGITGS